MEPTEEEHKEAFEETIDELFEGAAESIAPPAESFTVPPSQQSQPVPNVSAVGFDDVCVALERIATAVEAYVDHQIRLDRLLHPRLTQFIQDRK